VEEGSGRRTALSAQSDRAPTMIRPAGAVPSVAAMTNPEPTSTSPAIRGVAAAAFLAVPPLIVGGMLTSPPQVDDSPAAYLDSLAADPGLSILSANLFHYGWLLLAVAAPAALTLVRGPRGRLLTALGVLATMVGAIQMSGLLFSDWVNATAPTLFGLDPAVRLFTGIYADPSLAVWLQSGRVLGVTALVLLMAGLARNGVIGWWAAPVAALPLVVGPIAGGLVGGPIGTVVGGVVALALYAPLFLVGARLLRRTAADVTAAEVRAAAPAAR
jgi:hypothetical protein